MCYCYFTHTTINHFKCHSYFCINTVIFKCLLVSLYLSYFLNVAVVFLLSLLFQVLLFSFAVSPNMWRLFFVSFSGALLFSCCHGYIFAVSLLLYLTLLLPILVDIDKCHWSRVHCHIILMWSLLLLTSICSLTLGWRHETWNYTVAKQGYSLYCI